MLVAMNPFLAEACMKPDWPVVRSLIVSFRAFWPVCPGTGASDMWITRRSPEFIISVFLLGVLVAMSASCGLGGPVGTPLVWMNAKFVGSSQCRLQLAKLTVHSASLMCSDAHQWVPSQLMLSLNGPCPGG